jgi:hypothetical protein
VKTLEAAITSCWAEFGRSPDRDRVVAAICGTASASELADWYAAFVARHLGAQIRRPWFFTQSVGPVAALELDDDRVVVVKGYPPRVERSVLVAAHRVQARLAGDDFPCPTPLVGPTPLRPTPSGREQGASDRLATVDAWFDDRGNDFGPGAMAASAAGLARMVELAAPVDGVDALARSMMARRPGERYPEPHSPLFDFARPDPRISDIDDLADRALGVIDALDVAPVTIHGDWSARNVRFGPEGLRGVYDWDSLIRIPEALGVGIAAATWRSFGEADDEIAPDPVEVEQYLVHYEAARGRRFAVGERVAVVAQALFVLCYTARCEISLGPGHPVRALARLERSTGAYLDRLGA